MNKNHSLDTLIIDASTKEFLTYGYDKASLRRIASNAGVTIGAIYTRYDTKDKLFYSLVEPLIDSINNTFLSLETKYFDKNIGNNFIDTLQLESNIILHLLFDNYDMAKLLLTKSTGSSLENFFDMVVNKKTAKTIEFFKSKNVNIDNNIVKLLINCQFRSYYHLVADGYKLQDAIEMMNEVIKYHTAGWLALIASNK